MPTRYPVTLTQVPTLFQIKEVTLLLILELKCKCNTQHWFWMTKTVVFNNSINALTLWSFVFSATQKSMQFLKHTLICLLTKLLIMCMCLYMYKQNVLCLHKFKVHIMLWLSFLCALRLSVLLKLCQGRHCCANVGSYRVKL